MRCPRKLSTWRWDFCKHVYITWTHSCLVPANRSRMGNWFRKQQQGGQAESIKFSLPGMWNWDNFKDRGHSWWNIYFRNPRHFVGRVRADDDVRLEKRKPEWRLTVFHFLFLSQEILTGLSNIFSFLLKLLSESFCVLKPNHPWLSYRTINSSEKQAEKEEASAM